MPAPRILVAPSGFKGSLYPREAAAAIAAGIARACPRARITELPIVDGGEGFAASLAEATGGRLHSRRVTGPLGEPVSSHFGFLGDGRTAVLDVASAAGYRLIPRDRRDPLRTTTRGVGELIAAALDAGAVRLLLGCGDSGTNDAGAGMVQALGVRLLKADGSEIGGGGAALLDLHDIDLSARDPRLEGLEIEVACNIDNLLCGPRGVSRVFGPQKGASADDIRLLERALQHFAAVLERAFGVAAGRMPGGGASGGAGAALHALLGARLRSRWDVILDFIDLEGALRDCDIVFTGEGGIDAQTVTGKVPAEIGRRARALGIPVIALTGTIGEGADRVREHGVTAFFGTVPGPCTPEQAMADAAGPLAACAENAMRAVLAGLGLVRGQVTVGAFAACSGG